MNLALDLIPADGSGRLVVRVRKEKAAEETEPQKQAA